MKMLFVCGDHYPHDGACASLLKKIFFNGGLLNDQNKIHVATYRYNLSELNTEYVDGVKVHRFTSIKYIKFSDIIKSTYKINFIFPSLVMKLKRKILLKLSIGVSLDKAQIKEFENYLKELCLKESFDVIIGVAGCYEITIAAQNVSTVFHIPFVLYQVDPFTDNSALPVKQVSQRMNIECNLYKKSVKVFTTEIIKSKMKKRLDEENLGNVEVMEFPGVSIDSKINRMPKSKCKNKEDNSINCVFAGRVYKGVRNPTFTLKLFSRMPENIYLNLYGITEKELKSFSFNQIIPKNVRCYGVVSIEEADNAIKNADILVNIGNIMINQVPSKLFSYISTGKPILNVCVNQDCPSKKYLEHYPYSLSINEDSICSESLVNEVISFLLGNAKKTSDLEQIKVMYEKCTPAYAAKQMENAFEHVYKEK